MAKLPPLPASQVRYGRVQRHRTLPDTATYYRQHLTKLSNPNGNGWANALCPLHGDNNPSLMVNLDKGCFKCMACHKSGSNIAAFHAELTGTDYRTAFNALTSIGY